MQCKVMHTSMKVPHKNGVCTCVRVCVEDVKDGALGWIMPLYGHTMALH